MPDHSQSVPEPQSADTTGSDLDSPVALVDDDVTIEDVSIDGMCGVY